ncbi:hypothetical protein BUALT_Bualt08G0036800 [Buddleja alternifolia]|uniref:Sialate O-acetylesterase domain-containing protein n=1 Tax=Buddleja alternifolia TaxID=168488 RepID=A0AAV6XEB5_9LAMI|nr:hypothetical protein BUALT_Bualt08G0036800 [Buddleja alternifolia]
MFSLVFVMLLVYFSLVSPQSLSTDNALHVKNIIILAGQSNMAGRGGVINKTTWDGIVPPECRPNPLILRLSAALTWQEAQEPLHRDIDFTKICGVGPGMAFSNSVLQRDLGIGVIGLVPCAIGWTNISEWRRGGILYNQLVVALHGGGGMIRAILWYQGESDAFDPEDAKLYKKRLKKFITHVRSDLRSPLLPFIQEGLMLIIKKAQLEIDLPNVRYVDAKGLPLQPPDNLHLTTAAQVELGKKLADAFLQTMVPLPFRSSAPEKFRNICLDLLLRLFR